MRFHFLNSVRKLPCPRLILLNFLLTVTRNGCCSHEEHTSFCNFIFLRKSHISCVNGSSMQFSENSNVTLNPINHYWDDESLTFFVCWNIACFVPLARSSAQSVHGTKLSRTSRITCSHYLSLLLREGAIVRRRSRITGVVLTGERASPHRGYGRMGEDQ
jgi:hypothetical protein